MVGLLWPCFAVTFPCWYAMHLHALDSSTACAFTVGQGWMYFAIFREILTHLACLHASTLQRFSCSLSLPHLCHCCCMARTAMNSVSLSLAGEGKFPVGFTAGRALREKGKDSERGKVEKSDNLHGYCPY